MRYWFNVRNGNGFTPDEEGQLACDASAARRIAIESIRSIICEEALLGKLDLSGEIDVWCDNEDVAFTVAFIDAFDLRLPAEDT
ncbi:DUF6894 family protein [Sphingomonas baiyangensis]|uniref:DUF6894 domain-containing protein n=1 Tax=Sphingomonas baiyangensis TaxID=2572576 RepID=A0A4V5PTV7_9SPHN|nr:hypothetical protein [Sphingomonas baiyangensis]TKD51558.1 hypothetical protein FBR43_12935 [Sphingomonas baiyangensis]